MAAYRAWLGDEDDYRFIEHVRLHGRLPGQGAEPAWQTFAQDITFTVDDLQVGNMQRAAERARDANRKHAIYLSDEKLAELRPKWQAEAKAEAEHSAKLRARIKQREADEVRQRMVLAEERRRWKQARNRERVLPEERRGRWRQEDAEWSAWQAQQQAKRERDQQRRAEAKYLRRNPKQTALAIEKRAAAKRARWAKAKAKATAVRQWTEEHAAYEAARARANNAQQVRARAQREAYGGAWSVPAVRDLHAEARRGQLKHALLAISRDGKPHAFEDAAKHLDCEAVLVRELVFELMREGRLKAVQLP